MGEALRGAIEAGEVKREELWITSKLWCNAHGRDNVAAALRRTLSDLGLAWLDLYLIHWPVPIKPGVAFPTSGSDLLPPAQVPLESTWEGMEAAMEAGLTRHIGVSNFSSRKLHDLLAHCRIRPEVNQVEQHPLLQQPALVADCAAEGVHLTAYSPLGSQDRPAQVLIAWQLHSGISTIPKSVRPARLLENLAAAEITLTPDRSRADRRAGSTPPLGGWIVLAAGGGPLVAADPLGRNLISAHPCPSPPAACWSTPPRGSTAGRRRPG